MAEFERPFGGLLHAAEEKVKLQVAIDMISRVVEARFPERGIVNHLVAMKLHAAMNELLTKATLAKTFEEIFDLTAAKPPSRNKRKRK
ncbi:MAG: hypothetical protein CFE29_04555 [Bradyrhizobiaceae bacterium PARB1]|nr:MAG: hypothetical protein CFE29_04555 [Bradyrhizobiaceae bacterium PARB1]